MTAKLAQQQYDVTSVDELRQHPLNPRKGNVELIAKSIDVNGFYGAVVAQRSTGYVLAGNHRLLAAKQHGVDELPVIWLDVDDDAARRILLVDNRANDLASYDNERLAELLRGVELDGTGYTDDDLAKLLDQSDDDNSDESMTLGAESLSIIVECDSEQQQSDLLERFEGEGLICRPLMM